MTWPENPVKITLFYVFHLGRTITITTAIIIVNKVINESQNTLSRCLLSLSQKLNAPSDPAVAKV